VFVMPWLALDSGITWDERIQSDYGDRLLRWYRSGGSDTSAFELRDLFLYGGLFEAPAQWLFERHWLPLELYATRHVVTSLVGILGVLATWKIAATVSSSRAGVLAALMLLLTPVWSGHAWFNCKDIPFAAASAFVAYLSVRIALGRAPLGWSDALWSGLACGCALGVRSGGMFLLAYPVAAASCKLALAHARGTLPAPLGRSAGTLALRLGCTLLLAWAIMILAWPWAWSAPFSRPFRAARIATQFHWKHAVLFAGESVMSTELPRSYLPTWFAISLPESWIVAALSGVGAWLAARRRPARPANERVLALGLLALFVLAPIAAVLVRRPVLYDAQRHFLFVLPPAAALAGIALDRCFAEPAWARLRTLLALALAVPWLLALADMIALHPYEYVYFNRLSGGLANALGRYETDYWGASYREGFLWLLEHGPAPQAGKRLRVAMCQQQTQLDYLIDHVPGAAERFRLTKPDNAQFYLAITRNNCHLTRGTIIHTVERQGVPLLFVFRR
jgi:hypothetical protein